MRLALVLQFLFWGRRAPSTPLRSQAHSTTRRQMLTCEIMKQMKRPFSATVWREGDWYVSQCLDIDIASQGRTEEEALENLKEALALHFEPPCATHPQGSQD